MSLGTAKRRKVNDQVPASPQLNDTNPPAPDPMMAKMKAMLDQTLLQMAGMQHDMIGMNTRLSRMEELEQNISRVDELERTCEKREDRCRFLEARCGSLERMVRGLAKNQEWDCFIPPIPWDYWTERGFHGHYIDLVEAFTSLIKKKTFALRMGVPSDYVDEAIELGDGDEDNGTSIIQDDILMPHWIQLADALQLYHGSVTKTPRPISFSICNVQLLSTVIDVLAPALQGGKIKSLALVRNDFTNSLDGIKFAIEVMRSNKDMKIFGWANNPIDRVDDANRMIKAITNHPSLDAIRLENCFREDVDGYVVLQSLLASTKTFSKFSLESNSIRTMGRTHLPDYIATNPQVEELYMGKNHLNDNDAIMIAQALKQNTNLTDLRLGENDITEVGMKALQNAIFDSTSLNALHDSNHTCCIEGLADLGFNEIPVNNLLCVTDEIEWVNRGIKIYSLLSSRSIDGTNAQHLDLELGDDALKLVPKILECVHEFYDYFGQHVVLANEMVQPLSIMYELLRSWKMPELYERDFASVSIS